MIRVGVSILLAVSLSHFSACETPDEVGSVAIESGGSELRGRFFSGQGPGLRPTVLLIPGWPGGPTDVLGLGTRLSREGMNVLMVNPRGMHESGGEATFHGTLEDIGVAFRWLRSSEAAARFQIDTLSLSLGGYSFGGGMSMAYAASDPTVRRIISIAGTDHGEIIREIERNEAYGSALREMLLTTQAPQGPVRFDLEACLRELSEGQEVFGLRENASRLADRSILLIGGWEDVNTTVDQFMLPFYRALRGSGAEDVTFTVYHDDHGFGRVRDQLAAGIAEWIEGQLNH